MAAYSGKMYTLRDEESCFAEPCCKLYPQGSFQMVKSSESKMLPALIRFKNLSLQSWRTSHQYGKISHKAYLCLEPTQIDTLVQIEDQIKQQMLGIVLRRKLITQTVLDTCFISNINRENGILRVNCSCYKTACHLPEDGGLIEWQDDEELPTRLKNCGQMEGLVYAVVQPNTVYIMEDMSCGVSWDLKSLKFANETGPPVLPDALQFDLSCINEEEIRFDDARLDRV